MALVEGGTLVASAARTATGNSSDITNRSARGAVLYLDISAASGSSPTLDIKLQGKDPVSGNYVDIPSATFAQKTGTGTDTLTIFPGITDAANRSRSTVLPSIWRVAWTIGGSSPSFTFSIGVSYLG